MIVKVRAGDVESDRDTAIRLLARYVNPAYDRRRFDWLYQAAPAGQGRLWMAEDGSTGDVVGMAGAFPRRMLVQGREITGWLLGDFCVAETHRALGPALQLQRACLDDLAADDAPFCYDFPSRSMEAIYRRLRVAPSHRFLRLVRPLRIAPRLRRRGGPWLGAVGSLADMALGWTARAPRSAGGLTVAVHEGRCGEEFSALARRTGEAHGICGERSAQYLNWRYLDNPIQRHELLTARIGATLVGYVAVAREGAAATLVDVFTVPDESVSRALLRHAIARTWAQGATDVRVALVAGASWVTRLTSLGFRPRGDSPVVVYTPPGSELDSVLLRDSAWFLTHGDRDG